MGWAQDMTWSVALTKAMFGWLIFFGLVLQRLSQCRLGRRLLGLRLLLTHVQCGLLLAVLLNLRGERRQQRALVGGGWDRRVTQGERTHLVFGFVKCGLFE